MLHFHVHPPGKDGFRHILPLRGSWPLQGCRRRVWGLVTRLGDGWSHCFPTAGQSLVLTLERLSNSDPVNYVPFLKKVDK